jgi:hypothetical protein
MGGGAIAITSNGLLILSKQGRLTLAAAGLLAPTGSGSFDWRDQRSDMDLHELLVAGIERELREECKYDRADICETIILGYGRDMSRGGKPDFFAVSLVTKAPTVDRAEIGFIDQHESFDIRSDDAAMLKRRIDQIRYDIASRASKAVLANLWLLSEELNSTATGRIIQFINDGNLS